MATAPAFCFADLEIELHEQRRLIERPMVQIDRQQVILDVQFRRIADIQAELDLVKAAMRRVAPTFAVALSGAPPAAAAGVSSLRA